MFALKAVLVLAFVALAFAGVDPPVPTPLIWELAGGPDRGIAAGFDVVKDQRNFPWLFDLTYKEGKTMRIGNYLYLIPDGVALSPVNRYIQVNDTKLYAGWDEYWASLTKSASMVAAGRVNNTDLPYAFAQSRRKMDEFLDKGQRTLSWNGGTYLTFSMQFRGSWRPALSELFRTDIDLLPEIYEHGPYARFLGLWGTHYFTRAVYGCDYAFFVSIDNSFTGPDQRRYTTTQLDLYLKFNEMEFGMQVNREVNESSIDPKIMEATRFRTQVHGGDDAKFFAEKSFPAWLDSCHTIKAPLTQYSDVELISDLIADPKKKANVVRAILEYGKTGKLLPRPSPNPNPISE